MNNEIPTRRTTAPAATPMASVLLKLPPDDDDVEVTGTGAVVVVGVGVEMAGSPGLNGFSGDWAKAATGASARPIIATGSSAAMRRAIVSPLPLAGER
jgi:hypothetical protein